MVWCGEPCHEEVPSQKAQRRRPVVVLFSGKKCSGKDYIADQLVSLVESDERLVAELGHATLLHFADPVKRQYCNDNNVDFAKLTSRDRASRDFKEMHRMALAEYWAAHKFSVAWVVSRLVETWQPQQQGIAVVADWRHPAELKALRLHCQNVETLTVRVHASDDTRRSRGWVPCPGRDTHYTEVGLDDYDFDVKFTNSVDGADDVVAFLQESVIPLVRRLSNA
eukprot:PhM_4_TR15106/c0_g3_i1/m.63465/K13273/PMVK; phosphomevalonate kinase